MAAEPQTLRAVVGPEAAGARLDRFLATAWAGALSRARIAALIQAGAVANASAPAAKLSPSSKVREGDAYSVEPPPLAPAEPTAEAIPLDILYEDADLIVVDKPAGMTVHPAPGQPTGTLVNALLAHCGASLSGIGGVARPGIVHRIDKDTSGLLVVAKHDRAHQGLAAQFEAHTVERVYLGLAWGVPSPLAGRIETLIGRAPRDRKRMSAAVTSGKRAVTRYKVTAAFGIGAVEVECRLETGRTHQIRVHMAHIGWPLIGDDLYARVSKARRSRLGETALAAARAFPRQALHAATLGFRHPIADARLAFERAPPQDMQDLKSALETDAADPQR